MSKREELCPTVARTSPFLFFLLIILNCIISPSYNSFYLFVVYCIVNISNWVFKDLFIKPIYKLLNKTTLPILGSGARPKNAKSCSLVLDNKLATSYGMPSGHSQIAWTIAAYIIFKIIKNWYYNKKDNKIITSFGYIWLIISCIFVLVSAVYISYSRVYIEGCHTIQQVIVGGSIGIISGLLIGYYESTIVNLLSKIY